MRSENNPLLSLSSRELYLLPFERILETSGGMRCIIPSVKFSANKLERNRYYIDFTRFDAEKTEQDIQHLVEGLGLPSGARKIFDQEYRRYQVLRFVGVGPSRGRMTFRLYLGFADVRIEAESTAMSIDWFPGEDDFILKYYDVIGHPPRDKSLALIRESLGLPAGSGIDGMPLQERVASAVAAIIEKASGSLNATLVAEAEGPRRSVAFNYHKLAPAGNDSLSVELDALAEIFAVPQADFIEWKGLTQNLRLIDVAVGTGWDGLPFVSIYQGLLAQPPEYVDPASESLGLLTSPENRAATDIHPSMCKECADELSQAKPAVSAPSRPSLVYALGRVGYEFASDARREGFVQMGLKNPSDAASVLGYLDKFPYAAPDIHWTLSLGSAPIYVLQPYGAYGAEGYQRLRSYLKSQLEGKSDRVSVAGTMGGNVTLNSGQKVPLLYFDLRGFFSWSVDELLPTLAEELGAEGEGVESWQDELKNLLDRLYYELRNTGVGAADRAINYGATNAYIFYKPIRDALRESLSLRRIAVEASPFSPPGAEAYDVILEFFNPLKVHEEAGLVYRFTVDVSDVMPRLLDEPRSWRVSW